ncbi:MAG: hypothetical protein ABSB15_10270 [Bryobacteraceae bacterium]|jgi:hypothetical protein
MGSVANSLNGLTYLTQPGGLLSNLPSAVSTSALQSASPEDIVSLSVAAVQAQEVSGLFGIAQTAQVPVELPVTSVGTAGGSILPGVSPADLSGATPQEQNEINGQYLLLQQAQILFGEPLATPSGALGVTG